MWKLENNYSVHHILPKSQHGSNESINLELLRNSQHRALHTLFANQMLAEQLITTIWYSEKALREDVRERLLETLTSRNILDQYDRYKKDAIL